MKQTPPTIRIKMKHLNLRFLAAVLGISLAATALCAPKTPVCHGDTLRILAIGNSFSEDALEQEFIPLCKSASANVIVGNLYIGGCPVERHYDNLKNNKPDYSYRKSDTSGRCDTINNDVLSRALLDEPWDIISFQQASHDSGKKETYRNLPALIKDVRAIVGEHPRFVWHQTWAYSPDSNHGGFVYYGRDQHVMYDSICSAVTALVKANPDIKAVIPVGDVIQAARTTALGDDLTRDGYHLDKKMSRYIAAATWLRCLLGLNPAQVPYRPARVNEAQKKVIDSTIKTTVSHTSWPQLKPCGK